MPENHSHFLFRSEKSEKLRERPELELFEHVPLRLTNAQNLRMFLTTIAMSYDVSGSKDQSQINPLFKTNILRCKRFL